VLTHDLNRDLDRNLLGIVASTHDLDQDHIHQKEEEVEDHAVDRLYHHVENILEIEKCLKKILVWEYLVLA